MRFARMRRSFTRGPALLLSIALLAAQLPLAAPVYAGPPASIAFSAHFPSPGSTVGMTDPDVTVHGLETGGGSIIEATATIDGAPVAVSLSATGTAETTATFPTHDLTRGSHDATVTFISDAGSSASEAWTFSVAAEQTHQLTYHAGPGGSLVGEASQTVQYGTSATVLEDFEGYTAWTSSAGTQAPDVVDVMHGPGALKLTATPSQAAYSFRSVNLDLSSSAPFRLYFYLAEDPAVAHPDVTVQLATSGWASSMTAPIPWGRMQRGWNVVVLQASDFSSTNGATWSDTFRYLQVGVRAAAATSTVSFDELQADSPGMPLVAINFDDAHQSVYDYALPYMASRGMPGTMYTIPTRVGTVPYMSLAELKTMQSSGWDIGNHTWDHPYLTSLTQQQAEAEVTQARDWLVANGFTSTPSDVAYPNGAFDTTTVAAMRAADMRSGRTTMSGDNMLPFMDLYRIRIYSPYTLSSAKSYVDQAVARQSLVVLLFHAISDVASTYNFPNADFQALVDYIDAQPVQLARMSDVIDHHSSDGLSVTAVPDPHHHFTGWSDGVSTPTRRDRNVVANLEATATFAIDTFPITATVGEGGAISPAGVTQVPWDGSQTFQITPDGTHRIFRVLVDGVSVGPVTSYTFDHVSQAHTISVQFGPSATEPLVFAETPESGAVLGMTDPDVSVSATDNAGRAIVEATATIDGAPVALSIAGTGTPEAVASFPTYDLAKGSHDATVTFVAENGAIASKAWAFSVSAEQTHTLTYHAADGGSLVGDATQTVRAGTAATELEGFEKVAEWTTSGGTAATDTVNVLHGPTSLKLTSVAGTPVLSRRNVPLELSSSAPFKLYFFIAEDPLTTRPDITLTFGNSSARLTATIPRDTLQQGWNVVSLAKSDFTPFYGATWSDPYDYVRIGVSSATTSNISFDSLYQRAAGTPMVAVTFDDAAESAFANGFPYMRQLGIPGSMYSIPATLGTPGYMTVDQLHAMQAGGWDIANHSYSHPYLTALTPAQVQAQLTQARDWLIANGFPEAASDVAYPHGSYDATTLAVMRAAGMRSGRGTQPGPTTLPLFDPYRIKSTQPTLTAQVATQVDRAVAHGSLAVFMFHGVTDVTDTYNIAGSEFRSIIEHIAAQPVTLVRVSDLVDRHSNDGVAVTAVPSEHHHFVAWSDGITTATRHDTNVAGDIEATATFAIDTYSIDASAGAGGSITPTGRTDVPWDGTQTYSIAPDAHYSIADVVVDGVSVGAIGSYTFEHVAGPHTIRAEFAIDTYPIDASAGANGSVAPSGTTSVPWDGSLTYTVSPDPHYHVSDVLVDDVSVGAVTSYTFEHVNASHKLHADFAIDTNPVGATASAGGSITPSGTTDVPWDGSVTFSIQPDAHHHITDVSVDGASVGVTESIAVEHVTAPRTVHATFAIDTNPIDASAGAGGSITPSGTTNVPWDGSRTYTITPAEHHQVTDVRVDGVSVGAVTSFTFEHVTGPHTIEADFAIDTNPIATRTTAGGTISPAGITYVAWHGAATYQLIPDPGYHVSEVLVDGVSVGPVTSYTFGDVTAPHTISASFAPNVQTTKTAVSGSSKAKVRRSYRLVGTVASAPAYASGSVWVTKYRKIGGKWRSVGKSKVRVNAGVFTYTFKPNQRGTWRLVASYPGATAGPVTFTSSKSSTKSVSVR